MATTYIGFFREGSYLKGTKRTLMVNNNTQRIDVYDSDKFSDGRIIASLKFTGGKIPASTLLEDESGRQWRVQQYYWTTNSPEGYEKILTEEEQNIFQYLLVGFNHQDKPVKDSILKVKA